jgi:hypothetical protein
MNHTSATSVLTKRSYDVYKTPGTQEKVPPPLKRAGKSIDKSVISANAIAEQCLKKEVRTGNIVETNDFCIACSEVVKENYCISPGLLQKLIQMVKDVSPLEFFYDSLPKVSAQGVLLRDRVFYSLLIRSGDPFYDLASLSFTRAIKSDLASPELFGNYIEAVGRNKKCNIRQLNDLYRKAQERGFLNREVEMKFITACAHKDEFPKARKHFDDLDDKDSKMYADFIILAGEFNSYGDAQQVFFKAKNEKKATEEIFRCFYKVCLKNGKEKRAAQVKAEAEKLYGVGFVV